MKKMTRVQKKNRRRKFFLGIMLSLSLLFLIFILALKTEFFLINNIKVTGNNKVLHKTIIAILNIEKKENIFKVSIKDSKKNIKKLPYIKEVKIKRKFPKTVIIEVVERKEAIQIKNISSFVIIDEEGIILDNIDEKKYGLPLLIGFEVENKSVGDNLFSDIDDIDINFIKEGEKLNLLSEMEEIHISDNKKVDILLFSGIKVAFGGIDNVKYKLNLLKEVLKDIEKKELKCKMILMDRGENPIIVLEEEEG